MTSKNYFFVSSVIFLVIAVGHVLRLAYGWEVIIAGRVLPMWPSWVALVAAGYLAYSGFKLSK